MRLKLHGQNKVTGQTQICLSSDVTGHLHKRPNNDKDGNQQNKNSSHIQAQSD